MRNDDERLADIQSAIDRIQRYVQHDRTRFDTDELLQNAVLHWVEIIGEAARGVSEKVRDAHPEVPWRVITGMRDRVTHGYFVSRRSRRLRGKVALAPRGCGARPGSP